MGVDYSANFGIGVKIVPSKEDMGEIDSVEEYIDNLLYELDTKEYVWFSVGNGNYTGEQNDVYLVIKLNESLEECLLNNKLKLLINKLTLFLNINNIKHEKPIDIVGGLKVW